MSTEPLGHRAVRGRCWLWVLYLYLYQTIVTFAGVLLPELVACLIVVERKTPELLQLLNVVPTLQHLLDALDAFNRCAPGLIRDDADDLAFPSLHSQCYRGLMLICLNSLLCRRLYDVHIVYFCNVSFSSPPPPCGFQGCRIGQLHFLVGWRKRRLNQAFSFVLV